MPRENKHSRGRRDEKKDKKRKRDNEEEEVQPKRQKSQDLPVEVDFVGLDKADVPMPDAGGEEGTAGERPFYGMLEDEEHEYFRHADEMLELNDFPSDEDRSLFLANVYKEADGKELKIACSQTCSKLMERLILLSNTEQKKKLFEKFSGNFAHLVQHRFASHCCEALFIHSAPVVTEELTGDTRQPKSAGVEGEAVYVTMENLFLYTLNELEGQMAFLLTDRFASHTLRVLLVILSGQPLEKSSTKTLLQSKKKWNITVTGHETAPSELVLGKRSVPSSFQFAVEKIITDTIATMDTSFIRILATHPTGNPALQLLLELELSNPNTKKGINSDQKTLISTLLPDDIATDGSEAQTFLNGILYDPIGSRLLETICTHAPGKLFKQIYKTVFKDRIAAIARNEISQYVALRVLTRLSKDDLKDAVEAIIPQIPTLAHVNSGGAPKGIKEVQRNRNIIIKTIFERCHVRNIDTTALTAAVEAAYDSDPSTLLLKMACIDDISELITSTATPSTDETEEPPSNKPAAKTSPAQLHGSLLAQTMLTIPGPPSTLIQNSLLTLPHASLLALSLYTTTSHIIQSSLLPTSTNVPFRRKIINILLFPTPKPEIDPLLTLALSSTGSHILDSLLTSTAASTPPSLSAPLFNVTERISNVLIEHEGVLRESWTGRIVWRNWSLDLFKRKRGDWVKKVKTASITTIPEPAPITEPVVEEAGEDDKVVEVKVKKDKKDKKKNNKEKEKEKLEAEANKGKSAIQLAREKFARSKIEREKRKEMGGKSSGSGTGANSGVVVARS